MRRYYYTGPRNQQDYDLTTLTGILDPDPRWRARAIARGCSRVAIRRRARLRQRLRQGMMNDRVARVVRT